MINKNDSKNVLTDHFCCLSAEKLHYWTDPNVELSNFCGKCSVCGCDERYTYHVPESLWRRVLPERLWDEIVCAKCFHNAAIKIKNEDIYQNDERKSRSLQLRSKYT